jgi:hypothetical protein
LKLKYNEWLRKVQREGWKRVGRGKEITCAQVSACVSISMNGCLRVNKLKFYLHYATDYNIEVYHAFVRLCSGLIIVGQNVRWNNKKYWIKKWQ